MALRQAELLLAGFIEQTAVPALRELPFPAFGGKAANAPIYMKLLCGAFLPLASLFLLVAMIRGRFTLHRFLGLYVLLFLVGSASAWFNLQVISSEAGGFDLESSLFHYRGVPVEAVVHHVLSALLIATVYFALRHPGPKRNDPAYEGLYFRLWGAAFCALSYGYAKYYLPQRQFGFVRVLASLVYPLLGAQYLLCGHLLLSFGAKGLTTTIATVLPLIYTLLTVAATHQLGFVRLNADSLMGFRLFGVPLEELASYALLSTGVVQMLLIWDALGVPAAVVAPREELRARLVPMSSPQAKSKQGSPATPKKTPEGADKKKEKDSSAPSSPSTTPAKSSPAPATSSSSPKPKGSPQPKKKASQ